MKRKEGEQVGRGTEGGVSEVERLGCGRSEMGRARRWALCGVATLGSW
jgi:hypothetical protein